MTLIIVTLVVTRLVILLITDNAYNPEVTCPKPFASLRPKLKSAHGRAMEHCCECGSAVGKDSLGIREGLARDSGFRRVGSSRL